MVENLSNGAETTLNGAMDSSQTTATLTSASGWPAAPFRALISKEGANTDEIIYVGARSGTSLSSIIRAAEPIADGTQSGSAHASGATITQVLTAGAVASLTVAGVFDANSLKYGCKPNDSSFDNAALITAVIADAVTFAAANNGIAVVEFDSGEYWIKGSIGAGAGNNWSQIPLPVIAATDPKVVLILRPKIGSAMGLDNGTQTTIQPGIVIFRTNLTGQSFDGTHGIPSILGGPTYQKTSSFSNMQLVIQSIGFRAPANPSLCGVDASRLANVIFENCRWDTTDSPSSGITQPTHVTGLANIIPLNNNNAVADYRGLNQAIGWYAGVSIGEHTQAEKLFAFQCVVAFNVIGDYYHAAQIEHASAEWCPYIIGTVDPSSGLVNPSGASGYSIFNINLLDIEDAASGWGVPTYHIYDPGNDYYGRIRYMRVLAGVGTQTGALTVNGAAHLSLDDLTTLPSGGGGGGGGLATTVSVGARVYHTGSNQSAASATATALLFDSENYDTNGFHDTSTNTTRLTIPVGFDGTYLIGGGFYASVNCDIRIVLNGITTIAFGRAAGGDSSIVSYTVSTTYQLVAGDYVELVAVGQGSTQTIYTDVAGASPHFWFTNLVNISSFMGASAWNSTTQSIPSSTETPLTLDSNEYDTSSIHSTGSNTSRFTVPVGGAGKWAGFAYVPWGGSGGSYRYIWWRLNGTRIRGSLSSSGAVSGPGQDQQNTLRPIELADGDYLEVGVQQDAGTINAGISGDQRVAIAVWRVS